MSRKEVGEREGEEVDKGEQEGTEQEGEEGTRGEKEGRGER